MLIVDTYERFIEAMEWLNGQETVAYDVETTGLNVRKDTIIGFGVSSGVDGFYVPIFYWTSDGLILGTLYSDSVTSILNTLKSKKLLCWNASFDLRFTKNFFGVDLVPALHADVMLLKHTCDEEFPFGLKEVAVKIYGQEAVQEQTKLKESIKANGGTATQYFKADTTILAEYCVKDCELTYKLYNHYMAELRQQGLTSFYFTEEVLPLYKEVTIPLEETGIQLDIPLIKQTQSDIIGHINGLEHSIQEAIIPHLDLFTTWFLDKDYPLRTYTGKMPLWQKSYKSQHMAWYADVWASNPEGPNYMFNLQSKHHLKKLFFDTLKETSLSKTPTGLPQVNEDFLISVSDKYPWVKMLIDINRLSKLKSTYIDRLLEENEDGIYYPSFMQHRTVSGRYGSDVQQFPRPYTQEQVDKREVSELVACYTNLIRSFITARPGNKLVAADYAQLEPRTFCHVSEDRALREIFLSGQDFYTTIGCKVLGLRELTKKQRQDAKVYALGIPYGLTGYKLQFEIGCTNKEGDKLVEDYLNAFPKLKEWMRDTRVKTVSKGFMATQSGRVRHLSQAKDLFDKYGPVILDDLQLWHRYHDHPAVYAEAKAARKTFKNLTNNACNFQIQGLAASIMNRAMIAINRKINSNGLKAKLIMSIHDEVVYDCPESEIDVLSKIVQDSMENTTKLSIPLVAKPVIGSNFRECK